MADLLGSVALGQAGTGAAWMGPGSSFDPVQFAKYAGALGEAQKKAKDDAKKKDLDKLYAALKITPAKVLEGDQDVMNGFENQFINWQVQNVLKGNDVTPQDIQRGIRYKQEFDQAKQSHERHKEMVVKYQGMMKNKDADADAMLENQARFTNPEMFLDDPAISETFTPILEQYQADPVYSNDENGALAAAKNQWRNDYGAEYVTVPIYKPESMLEDWKKALPLLPENKQHYGKRLADGTEITSEYVSRLQDDMPVVTQDGEKIILKGTKSLAGDWYDDNPSMQKSTSVMFNKLDEGTKQDYIDQFGEDAQKQFYVDFVSPYGVIENTTKTNKADVSKKNVYNFGGNQFETDWDIKEFTDKTNIQRESEKDLNIGGDATIDGFTFTRKKGGGEGQSLTLSSARPSVIYRQNNGAQETIPNSYTMDISDVRVQRMATSNGLTWEGMRSKPSSVAGKSVFDLFMDKFGDKYKENGVPQINNLNGIVLTDDEAEFFKKEGMGSQIKDGYFVAGQANFYEEGKKGDKNIHYSDALIPLDNSMASKIEGQTGVNPIALLNYYPLRDWSGGFTPKTKTASPKNKVVNPVEKINEAEGDSIIHLK